MPRRADPALPLRRRNQILDAARVCFGARGFRHTTIEEICGEARISPGALYRYFGSKADIVAAIALDARAEAEALLDQLADAEGLISGITDLARAVLETSDPALSAEIWAEALRDPALAEALATRLRATRQRLAASVRRAQVRGMVHPALDADDIAELLVSALDGAALHAALTGELGSAINRFRALALHLLKPKR